MAVLGIGRAHATNQGITGNKLLLKSGEFVLLSKDPSINITGSDPVGGADSSLTFNDGSGPVSLALPKTLWSTNGSVTLFKYKNASAPGGPSVVKIAMIKPGLLKVVAKGLPFAVPNGAATIAVVLSIDGKNNTYCMTFGGTGDGSKFLAKDAGAGTCSTDTPTETPTTNATPTDTPTPTVTPACGNGVIEAGEECDDNNRFNLDGCDSNCRYEVIVRWSSVALQGTAAPAALGCSPATNRLGAQAFTSTALGQINPQLQNSLNAGTSNPMMQFYGLDDLTGVADANGLTLGVFGASPDPAKGAWPGNNPLDWWFLTDNTWVDSTGLSTNVLTPATLAARQLAVGPTDVNLALPYFGTLRLRRTHVAASINAAPAPDVPAPPPSQLAAGLMVFQSMTGSGAGQGLCGNITVASLAAIPVPATLAQGAGSSACGNCAGSHTYTACVGSQTPNNSNCNSLLDAIVGGCGSVPIGGACLVTVLNPTQPDVPAGGTVTPLALGAGNKVPVAVTMSDDDAYSAYFKFDANRQHFTGQICTATAECQTGKTCISGTCQ
jgi:cysteine-rich repeat protein